MLSNTGPGPYTKIATSLANTTTYTDTTADPTLTTVVELGDGEVLSELVRMLGAEEDDSGARRHARELRRAA